MPHEVHARSVPVLFRHAVDCKIESDQARPCFWEAGKSKRQHCVG